jgi:hypothetical protein
MYNMTPEEYYKANIYKEKEYVRVFPAYLVRCGEMVSDGMNLQPAKEDGYELDWHFYTKDELEAKTTPAEDLALPAPKNDLSEEQLSELTPVSKGEEITAIFKFDGTMQEQTAQHDGFLVTYPTGRAFMTNFEFTSHFNYVGKKCKTETDPITVIINKRKKPVKGILIDEPTTFDYGSYKRVAPAGAVLLNKGASLHCVFNTEYRLTEKSGATEHKTALERQDRLKELARPLSPR